MFNLETQISTWRERMREAGFKSSAQLAELEIHLREEIQQQTKQGLDEADAFNVATQEIGQPGLLQDEFAKVKEPFYRRLKRHFFAFAGIPEYQLATNMNAPNQNLEPGWATYLKTAAFVVPAVFVWCGLMIFVLPKLKEICAASGMAGMEWWKPWKPIRVALAFSDFIRMNLIVLSVAIATVLALLEWRSNWWPRYRRLVFGIFAYVLNFLVLFLIATLSVVAVAAGANLLHGK